ncbi:MAG: S16 family serine protease [Dehalococcoidales bacterium]
MGSYLKYFLLRIRPHIISGLPIRLWHIDFILETSWLLIAPVSLWVIIVFYIPIMGTGLNSFQVWAISLAILMLMFLSLFLHYLAHMVASRASGDNLPDRIFLSPLGDPAQYWPAAPDAGKEALTALSGPLANCLLTVIFYILWNLQINQFTNIVAFFLIFFNLGLMAINLIPAFPFDGARLIRAIIWRILGLPGLATRLALRLGWGISVGLFIWGIILIVQQARFSLETAAIIFIFCALIVISLALRKAWKWDRRERVTRLSLPTMVIRSSLVVLLLFPLAAVTLSLIPLNEGLEAPGFTASVEPMVQMPSQYRHSSTGSFILTTVIPQAPILASEWVYAHFDHSIKLEAQEQIVPSTKTPQSVSQENHQMLLDSETTAIIMGLRLAGYPVEINYDGVSIVSILPSSPAATILQPDDIITEVNGTTVIYLTDLTKQLESLPTGSIVNLRIERNGQTMVVSVPTMEPLKAGGPVRIGISIVQHNSGFTLPFPVEIVPKKVNGGPSAGLIFTLGVYDLVTGQDLTRGREIAGTGTIDLEGNVGPIGGVQQKVVAAERAGAEYFLSPVKNYQDALAIATHIKVIKIATAQDAINFLQSLPPLKTG